MNPRYAANLRVVVAAVVTAVVLMVVIPAVVWPLPLLPAAGALLHRAPARRCVCLGPPPRLVWAVVPCLVPSVLRSFRFLNTPSLPTPSTTPVQPDQHLFQAPTAADTAAVESLLRLPIKRESELVVGWLENGMQ